MLSLIETLLPQSPPTPRNARVVCLLEPEQWRTPPDEELRVRRLKRQINQKAWREKRRARRNELQREYRWRKAEREGRPVKKYRPRQASA